MLVIKSKQELKELIALNIPFAIKPTKKAKTMFITPFTSRNALESVINGLTDGLWKEINKQKSK